MRGRGGNALVGGRELGGEVAMVFRPAEGCRAEGRAVVRLAAIGREPKLEIVVLPQPGIRGGRGQAAQEGDALAKLRLEIRQRIEVAATAHARDLRAQLFSLRRTLLAPDLALEAAVEFFEEFLLIGAQRLHGGRIEARDCVLPCRRELPIGRGLVAAFAAMPSSCYRRKARAAAAPAERRCGACGDPLFFQQQLALLDQPVELFLLLGDPIRIAVLVLRAGQRGGLLDELPDVVARDGDALFEFGKR